MASLSGGRCVNEALDPAKRDSLIGKPEYARSAAKWLMGLGPLTTFVIACLGTRPEAALEVFWSSSRKTSCMGERM
jgi:hypothetical protein